MKLAITICALITSIVAAPANGQSPQHNNLNQHSYLSNYDKGSFPGKAYYSPLDQFIRLSRGQYLNGFDLEDPTTWGNDYYISPSQLRKYVNKNYLNSIDFIDNGNSESGYYMSPNQLRKYVNKSYLSIFDPNDPLTWNRY
ncbi:hypothetical protein CONCODRAFT_11176 [Conidiobolus coronatus NRRL 28638]|uniref:Uncharacterized protein n=1 Tax=Conidiobolus coronatus (strain ATCC 28846 / CBS 209.66 / NRRL 28638) TaxID=796925 RepID=A0A137NW26_CONC2|nr:hypothetical protein CONCODRAFT_11176 [Conidiobolus coronatus NRRL 28638]|eukprot:KXN66888.1 hypothetical protein CONCODRAFT_11176 [Conidiobolus coronatus NRRL 28638]